MATKQFNRTVEAINELLNKLDGLPSFPLVYRGEVLEYTDLPEEPAKGDCYIVSFETGTDHVSNKLYYYSGAIWKEIAVDGYTKHEIDTLLSAKQDALSSEQLDAVNSGITSADVEQITKNKNNISYNTDMGVKNLINIRTGTEIVNGVTFTFNADKTVTVSGTATGGAANLNICSFTADAAYALNGKILSGCPANGSDNTYIMQLQRNSSPWNVYAKDTGNETTISGVAQASCILLISIAEGQTVNLTFKPMIRQFGDNTYQPYALSNAELTAAEKQEDILSTITTESGYTVTENRSWLRKQGNHIFGMILMQKSTAYSSTLGTAATVTYKPEKSVVLGTFLSSDGWGVSEVGYAFIHPTTGAMSLKANSSYSGSDTYMLIPIDYMIS